MYTSASTLSTLVLANNHCWPDLFFNNCCNGRFCGLNSPPALSWLYASIPLLLWMFTITYASPFFNIPILLTILSLVKISLYVLYFCMFLLLWLWYQISQAKQGQSCLVLRGKTWNKCCYPLCGTGEGTALFVAGILLFDLLCYRLVNSTGKPCCIRIWLFIKNRTQKEGLRALFSY